MNSEQDTLPNLQTVLDAINNLQQEMNKQFADLRKEMNARFSQVYAKLNEHDERFEQIRPELMSFDAPIDRFPAMSHETLNIGYNLRADVKILREEVSARSKNVAELQLKAA